MPQKIAHITFSSAGGTGSVARILSDQQTAAGMDSRLLRVIDSSLRSSPLSAPLHTLAAALDEYAVKRPSFASPISLARDFTPGLSSKFLSDANVIHLHGINGALRQSHVSEMGIKNRLVWTLHDMNPFTGSCHYSLGCANFTDSCSACPAVLAPFQSLVARNLERKKNSVRALQNLSLVAPSKWLAEQATQSQLFRDKEVQIINNPVDPVFFKDGPQKNPPDSPKLKVVVVAQNLSDPVKQVRLAVEAFSSVLPKIGDGVLTLIGGGGAEFDAPGVTHAGTLEKVALAKELWSADALIVPSQAENSPLVIGEAAATGCIPVVAKVGGMEGMVSDLGAGSVFASVQELSDQLFNISSMAFAARGRIRRELRARALDLYSPESVSKQYEALYANG